jgi:hypothetical protein
VKTALNLLVFAVSISVWITDRECGKRTVPVCSMLEETKRDAPPNAERRTPNGERHWKEAPAPAKMGSSAADSPEGFIRIVSLTIMVPVPRYRLAVGRLVAEEREGQDLGRRSPVQQWTEVNLSKTKAILNV